MTGWTKVIGTARGPFLLLAPACALPGVALADWTLGETNWVSLLMIVTACITGHISVNVFNEVDDAITGLDEHTTRTPFSGGSGTLQQYPELLTAARVFGWIMLLVTVSIGAFFVWQQGPVLALIGGLGVITVLGYPRFVRYPLLCLVAPGVGFGTVMTLGAFAARTGTVSSAAFMASLVPFFMVSNLLLLNQFPDLDPDREAGRRHIPIVWGRKRAAILYGCFHLLAYCAVGVAVLLDWFPIWSLLCLLTVPLAALSFSIALRHHDSHERIIPALVQNVLTNLLTPTLMAIGFWVG